MSENQRKRNDQSKTTQGDDWDRIGLKAMKAGKHHTLYKGTSKYQNIEVLEATDVRMYLNEQLQFSSLDERIYHEALVHPAFSSASEHGNVLILGGGDGLALREVLKYRDVKYVDLVDIDSKVLRAAAKIPRLVSFNKGSLLDKRVHLHPKDAWEFISSNKRKYDIVIVDFPDPADEVLSRLYTTDFFSRLPERLSSGGVIVCQSNSPVDTPVVYWTIGRTIESTGFHTLGYHVIVPSFGDWGFHLAAKNPLSLENKSIKVKHATLPANLSSLCKFPQVVLQQRFHAEINSLHRLILHFIYQKEMAE